MYPCLLDGKSSTQISIRSVCFEGKTPKTPPNLQEEPFQEAC